MYNQTTLIFYLIKNQLKKERGWEVAKPIIELKDVVKVYDNKTILDNINLSINKGDFVTLLGPSRKW